MHGVHNLLSFLSRKINESKTKQESSFKFSDFPALEEVNLVPNLSREGLKLVESGFKFGQTFFPN